MQIDIKSNACILNIHNDSVYAKSIEKFINKNFKRVLAFTNTRLVFTSKAESFKRTYFLQWAYQVYCKTNLPSQSIESKLKTIQDIPIKIIFISKKAVTQKLKVYVELLEDQKIIIQSKSKNKQLSLYLKMRFGKAFLRVVPKHKGVYIKVKDKETLRKLKSFLSCSSIMGLNTEFIFPSGRVDNISIEKEESSIIKNAFTILQTGPDASMKEIKANYKKLIKKYHPDKVFMCDADMISTYTAKFQSIQDAFDIIKQKSA